MGSASQHARVRAPRRSHFEYIERTSSKARGGARAEPPRARHTVADYPVELKKKVTLLEHFRSHLVRACVRRAVMLRTHRTPAPPLLSSNDNV